MPVTRKTRSGRPAPAPPSKRIRTKGGCLTCRIRRKKCDESREHNEGCETCARLRIQCLGYSNKRPEWLKGQQVDAIKRKIKHFLADHSAKSSSRSSDDAFLSLHTSADRPPLPRQHSESEHSDSDSEFESKPLASSSSSHEYSSPTESCFDMESMPWHSSNDWSQSAPIPQFWDPPFDFYHSSYVAPGHEDVQPCFYMPELVDPLDMYMLPFDHLMTSSYESYSSQSNTLPRYDLFFNWLRVERSSGSLDNALVGAFENDPEGLTALMAATEQDGVPQLGQQALEALTNNGYDSDRPECRALVCLCLMMNSLARGDGSLWGNSLDLILGWAKGVYSQPQTSSLADTHVTQLILDRAARSDIIAGATTQRQPLLIDSYRTRRGSPEAILDGCPNEIAIAMAEAVALAAHSDQIHRAGKNLDALREELSLDEVPSKAAVHKAGARLYLEIAVHAGAAGNTDIEEAASHICTLSSQMNQDQLRDFAFWIFLAGCNTTDRQLWSNCYTMLSTGWRDHTVKAATEIMSDVWHARGKPNFQPSMWRTRMNERGLLLV
ncbi:Fungal Zn(2)-Cys(6) binuclear cluster domain [Ceratobasidium sp. AG-Ba]|nr:Fungal Zn(2)-Cys(6) binuclear cluster domain [Ceratobasidium sp. AG-Ba]